MVHQCMLKILSSGVSPSSGISDFISAGIPMGIIVRIHLVGGLEHFYDFPYIGNVIIPTDFHIFQRGRSTTHQS